VADDLHARFSARRREYTYFIHRQKDPFVRSYSWQCGYPGLDFEAMNKACQFLLGTHDFSCFEKTGTDNKTSICTVYEAFWAPYTPSHILVMDSEERSTLPGACPPPDQYRGRGPLPEAPGRVLLSSESPYWYFRIAADRFLRNMVRATVGTLIEVGRGKHAPEWVAELIESGTRGDAGESVPGHALFLNKVEY
jgi:tRNA pseudouridine38-40 synthase